MKSAIGVVSIGDRPWVELTYPTVCAYANRIGATPLLYTGPPPHSEFALPPLPDSPGRAHKLAYAAKTYYPWSLLENFDQVAILDDTCIVCSDTPNLFEVLQPGCVAAVREPYLRPECAHEQKKILRMLNQFSGNNQSSPIFDRADWFFNSGVMVYDRSFRDHIDLKTIIDAHPLLYADFPHQTLSYYLLKNAGIPIQHLPESFNHINLFSDERQNASPFYSQLAAAFIYHVTGWWPNRLSVVDVLTERLKMANRL